MRRVTGAAFATSSQAYHIKSTPKKLEDAATKIIVADSRGDRTLVFFDWEEGTGDIEWRLFPHDNSLIPVANATSESSATVEPEDLVKEELRSKRLTERTNIAALWNSDLLWEGKDSLKLQNGEVWAVFDDQERLIDLRKIKPEKNLSHTTTMLEIKDDHIYTRGTISPLSFGYQLDIVNWLVSEANRPPERSKEEKAIAREERESARKAKETEQAQPAPDQDQPRLVIRVA